MNRHISALGALIKIKRVEKGITQTDLAKGICATSYLSKIENCEIQPNEDVLHLLLKKLGMQYYNKDSFTADEIEKLSSYNRLVFSYDIPKAKEVFTLIEGKRNKFICSPLLIEYLLAECHYMVLSKTDNKIKLRKAVGQLKSIEQYIDGRSLSFYYFIRCLVSDSLAEKKQFIQKSVMVNPYARSYKLLAMLHIGSKEYSDAIEALNIGLQLCLEEGNFRGIAYINNTYGEIYSITGVYDKAEQFYDRNISLIKTSGTIDKYVLSFIYYSYVNKANIAFLMDKEEKMLEFCNLAKAHENAWDGKLNGIMHYLIMCEYYLKKDRTRAAKLLTLAKDNYENSITIDSIVEYGMMDLLDYRLQNADYLQSKEYHIKLKTFDKNIMKNGRYHYMNYINKILVEYYIANKKYKDAYLISSRT